MTDKEEFEFFVEQLLSNAAKEFKATGQYKLLQEKLNRMDTDCETILNPCERGFVTEYFELLLDVGGHERTIFDENSGIYRSVGDYRLPNLIVPDTSEYHVGIWGQRRLDYLKEHKRVLHINLLTSGKLIYSLTLPFLPQSGKLQVTKTKTLQIYIAVIHLYHLYTVVHKISRGYQQMIISLPWITIYSPMNHLDFRLYRTAIARYSDVSLCHAIAAFY